MQQQTVPGLLYSFQPLTLRTGAFLWGLPGGRLKGFCLLWPSRGPLPVLGTEISAVPLGDTAWQGYHGMCWPQRNLCSIQWPSPKWGEIFQSALLLRIEWVHPSIPRVLPFPRVISGLWASQKWSAGWSRVWQYGDKGSSSSFFKSVVSVFRAQKSCLVFLWEKTAAIYVLSGPRGNIQFVSVSWRTLASGGKKPL